MDSVRPRAVVGASLALPLALLLAPDAGATCGSTQCFLDRGLSAGPYQPGAVSFDLSFQYIDQSRKLSGTRDVGEVLVPEISFEEGEIELDHHREERTLNTLLNLDLGFGVTPRVALFAGLPLYGNRDHEHFVLEEDGMGGGEFVFSGDDGTSGFGDVRVGVRGALLVRLRDMLEGELAVELPTGAFKLRDAEGTINEPSIQPGSGSYDLITALRFAHQIDPDRWDLFVSASHQLNNENDLDYELGDSSVLNVGFWHHPSRRAEWSLQLNGRHSGRDAYRGDDVPSTGADYLNLTPGVRLRSQNGTTFYAFAQVPIHQEVNEQQLAPRTGLLLGVTRSFP